MKRFIIFCSIAAILVTSCSGLASSSNSEVANQYGTVTVFTAPT